VIPAGVDGGARFADSNFSVGSHLDGSRFLGYTVPEHHPCLRPWLDACASLPDVAEGGNVGEEASEVSEALADFTSGLGEEGPPRVRRIRDHRLESTFETGAIDIVQECLEIETVRYSAEYE
jgi:hypothetical protein